LKLWGSVVRKCRSFSGRDGERGLVISSKNGNIFEEKPLVRGSEVTGGVKRGGGKVYIVMRRGERAP